MQVELTVKAVSRRPITGFRPKVLPIKGEFFLAIVVTSACSWGISCWVSKL